MSGSTFGKNFTVTTWGESHGFGIGAVIDGCPSGLILNEERIQTYLNRRKPGVTKYATPRKEGDKVKVLSGVFEGVTTGTPISLCINNENQQSKDYSNIANCFRPGHADYTFQEKYGIRDYRGGGRSSGRETAGRVAAGAIAMEILKQMEVKVTAYTKSIGNVTIDPNGVCLENIMKSPLFMPDLSASRMAEDLLEEKMKEGDSLGGVIECVVTGMPTGIGEPVFDKLDANLAKAVLSIGAVKGVEIGDGFDAAYAKGSQNNDGMRCVDGKIVKITNHAGGVLGGMSDGSDIVLRAAIKPTPSIGMKQETVTGKGEEIDLEVTGRHDPIIVPRAVVVVEAMTAITLVDMLFTGMFSQMDRMVRFYKS